MCNTCGCNITADNAKPSNQDLEKKQETTAMAVLENLLNANNQEALHNRQHFDAKRVLAINIMSSPGSGKTRLLEVTLPLLKEQGLRTLVIEGDLATENDAKRLQNLGFAAIQINTVSACHLDAQMIHTALHQVDLAEFDIVFIENVGNLVCPASFDLGQHYNVTLLSVGEGSDKPLKYPVMFKAADVLLVSKSDLLPYFDDFSLLAVEENLRQLANDAPVIAVSAKDHASLLLWLRWLLEVRVSMQARWRQQQSRRPWIAGTASPAPASAVEAPEALPLEVQGAVGFIHKKALEAAVALGHNQAHSHESHESAHSHSQQAVATKTGTAAAKGQASASAQALASGGHEGS